MKRIVVILVLTINWLISNGQTGPVFQYTHPSKQTLKELAKEETVKGYVYRTYLINRINLGLKDTTFKVSESYIDFIFNHLYLEEVYLSEGNYMNSGYDPSLRKMNQSIGHKWQGFAWVFRIGTYSIILIKEDCGNILTVSPIRKFVPSLNTEVQKPIIERPLSNKNDWVFQEPKKLYEPKVNLYLPPASKEKKKIKIGWVVIPVGVAILGTAAYFFFKDYGGPAGAPGHDSGGPAGSPGFGGK